MSRKSFYELCDMVRPYLEKKRTHLRTPRSVVAQAGSFLYYISDKGRYRKTVVVKCSNKSGSSSSNV